MRARYYEAESGRFISEDPARDGANWYAYSKNNPVSNVDSSGNSEESDQVANSVSKWIQAFIGVAMIAGSIKVSTVSAIVAVTQLACLLAWFTLDLRSMTGDGYQDRLIGSILNGTMVDWIAQAATSQPRPQDMSPFAHAFGIIGAYAGFLTTFMALEDIASGY